MAATPGPGPTIALAGNPNVGKSTVFNALTNLHQHTGNWPGKTVATATGVYTYHGKTYTLVDLPGAYSLHPGSAEEEVTRDYLLSGQADVTLVVADATCLERNLALVLQIMEIAWRPGAGRPAAAAGGHGGQSAAQTGAGVRQLPRLLGVPRGGHHRAGLRNRRQGLCEGPRAVPAP